MQYISGLLQKKRGGAKFNHQCRTKQECVYRRDRPRRQRWSHVSSYTQLAIELWPNSECSYERAWPGWTKRAGKKKRKRWQRARQPFAARDLSPSLTRGANAKDEINYAKPSGSAMSSRLEWKSGHLRGRPQSTIYHPPRTKQVVEDQLPSQSKAKNRTTSVSGSARCPVLHRNINAVPFLKQRWWSDSRTCAWSQTFLHTRGMAKKYYQSPKRGDHQTRASLFLFKLQKVDPVGWTLEALVPRIRNWPDVDQRTRSCKYTFGLSKNLSLFKVAGNIKLSFKLRAVGKHTVCFQELSSILRYSSTDDSIIWRQQRFQTKNWSKTKTLKQIQGRPGIHKQDFSESSQFQHHQSSSNISKEKGTSNVSRIDKF